ncbi:MAG: replicative helicase Mcm [Candidatus Methanomethylophilaceae archaeon]|nr:replicative helicase Mcm [Candidatus Methanomethylophilaceae archaeon]
MTVNYSWDDLLARWDEFFASSRHRTEIAAIADRFPEVKSLHIAYREIDEFDPDMAMLILEKPDTVLEAARQAAKALMLPARDIEINVRIEELPRDSRVEIRQLRSKHLGRLIAVEGLVRKTTEVRPRMTKALFQCARCGAEIWELQNGLTFHEPMECYKEQGGCEKSASATKFTLIPERSLYIDTQKIEIQESPEGLRGGAQPERLTAFAEDDIAGIISPGDRITVNGILRSVQKGGRDKSSLFDINLDIISIEFQQHEYDEIMITPEDEALILKESRSPDLFKNIVRSISPTIYGMEKEKEAIALQLFGGCAKKMDDGTNIRGDIHILLIGDPGVAKSQLLRYMSELAPRGIYASGKSASAAGLCIHGDTVLYTEKGDISIREYVESIMDAPEEYRPGIWRQEADRLKLLSLTESSVMRTLPIKTVWRIKTPSFLVEIVTEEGRSITLTAETKLMGRRGHILGWFKASEFEPGDATIMFNPNTKGFAAIHWGIVKTVKRIEDELPEFVYDLTVEPTHSFIGNGFVIHNTAAAVKDDFGDGRWTLEAGALVLADKGLACIDELDKMSTQDRSSLHEAMESQRISVAKAGITATLQCRCSLLAAANPKYGRFEQFTGIAEQIDLPPALMSRFDMIFVLTDRPNHERDRSITEHILKSHLRGQARSYDRKESIGGVDIDAVLEKTSDVKPVYDIDFLRKYVAYSKRIVPILSDEAMKIINDYYLDIRRMGEDIDSSVPITARQLEAFIRLSEASARARLSQMVSAEDAKMAVDIVRYYLEKIVGTESGQFDIDMVATGISKSQRTTMKVVSDIIRDAGSDGISIEELLLHAQKEGISEKDVHTAVKKLMGNGDIIKPRSAMEVYRMV